MLELKGKYNKCKVYTDIVDNTTISQLTNLMNQESVKDSKIRIMPDCHAGKGCVVGTTMTLKDKVIPNLVGVDIGCFTGDTRVWCSAGYYRTIKELAESGKEFFTDCWDNEQKCFVSSKATAFKTRENAELVEVTYNGSYTNDDPTNDVKVRCTPDHKFLVCKSDIAYYKYSELEWVEAKDLKSGMRLVADDLMVMVKNVRELAEREDVYCLNVPEHHNFAIYLGVIVHNCGMLAVKLKEKRINLPELDSVIRKNIPSGGEVHAEPKVFKTSIDVEYLRCYGKPGSKIRDMLAYRSVGTLGSGNHFIEVDKDSEGNLWLVVHTGSRHLGLEVCDYYQNLGYKKIKDEYNGGNKKLKVHILIEQLKAEKRYSEINDAVKKFSASYKEELPKIPYELAYVEGQDFEDYIHDMNMVQKHASCNRAEIVRVILKKMKLHEVERFETIHNYIDTENMILRKGAVSAQADEKLLIPINMRDGSLICLGKGNEDWNYSAPHGSGRKLSRSEAKERLSMSEFKSTMKEAGIYTTCVNKGTIDESPMAYKSMDDIVSNIGDTVEIIDIIKPIYNFKAGEEETD